VPSSNRWGVALCLWCLNPAVVFKSLSEVARSVLLTSGTLSPLDSFSGELGLNFHIKLEAPHVVDMHRQVRRRPSVKRYPVGSWRRLFAVTVPPWYCLAEASGVACITWVSIHSCAVNSSLCGSRLISSSPF
jgi:hypothetical protein